MRVPGSRAGIAGDVGDGVAVHFDTDRIKQHQAADTSGLLKSHLDRDPTTHGVSDDRDVHKSKVVEQVEVEGGESCHAIQLVGSACTTETGMGGCYGQAAPLLG